MKLRHIFSMLLGLAALSGCAQTPADIRNRPEVMTEHSPAPYKLLGQCLQKKMRDETFTLGMTWSHDLRFQDWAHEAELVAGTHQDIAYIVVFRSERDSGTLLKLHVSPYFMGFEVNTIRSKLQQNLTFCEALLTRAQ